MLRCLDVSVSNIFYTKAKQFGIDLTEVCHFAAKCIYLSIKISSLCILFRMDIHKPGLWQAMKDRFEMLHNASFHQ